VPALRDTPRGVGLSRYGGSRHRRQLR
jgi:hypothetical protein